MIKHNFFGKECHIDRALSNRSDIEDALKEKNFNFTNIAFVNQIHSAEICVIDNDKKIHGTQNLPKADAIVTNLPRLAIAVVTADCSPILLQDSQAKVIAVVHAGWRGARSNIIAAAVREMKNLGAEPAQIRADIGPMIHQESYRVGPEFIEEFITESAENKKFFIADKASSSHYLFDLPGYVKEKLQQQNIKNIHDINIDTYANYKNYASYRKATHEGVADFGRNISLIMIDEESGA